MNISSKGLDLLKQLEGCSSKEKGKNAILTQKDIACNMIVYPYFCSANKETIGFGTTIDLLLSMKLIDDEKANDIRENGILLSDYEILFAKTLKPFEDKVLKEFCTVELNQSQFDALVCFVYNIGSFGETLKRIIKEDTNHYLYVQNIWLRYHYSNGKPLKGLMDRRQKELDLYFSEEK